MEIIRNGKYLLEFIKNEQQFIHYAHLIGLKDGSH